MKTAYETLEITEKASDDEIKSAYLNEIQKCSHYPVNKGHYYKDIEAAFYAIESKYKRIEYELFYVPIVTAIGLLEAAAPKITKLRRPSIEAYERQIICSVDGDDESEFID